MKTCYKCKVEKDDSQYTKSKKNSDGLFSWCKQCRSENVKINSQVDIEKIAHLIDGKQVYVVEPQLFYDNWWSINKLYNGTNRSYLLLEQNNPGILYHLFNNNSQYDRITPIYSAYGQRPDCDKDILIYHKGMYVKKESEANVIPNCFELVANSTNYNVYRNK
jgi:hypothetical protein